MSWVSLTVDVAEPQSEAVQALLHELGAAGLEVRDPGQQTMPQVRAPGPGECIVVAWFEQRRAGTVARAEVKRRFPRARQALEAVVERDWSTEWRSQIRSVTVGRLWVGPPWERASAPKDKVRLFIEPKMAFGTGDHPTTSLCLAAVDAFLAEHPRATVLDVGTGTGVLAFAARLLGATRVEATDNDPVAVQLARECAQENGVTGVELSTRTLDQLEGTYDLVLANILANTLIELAPLLAARVKRRLVLAGVLLPQADQVRAAFVAEGLRPRPDTAQGEWVRLEFDRPPSARRRPAKASPVTARANRALAQGRKRR